MGGWRWVTVAILLSACAQRAVRSIGPYQTTRLELQQQLVAALSGVTPFALIKSDRLIGVWHQVGEISVAALPGSDYPVDHAALESRLVVILRERGNQWIVELSAPVVRRGSLDPRRLITGHPNSYYGEDQSLVAKATAAISEKLGKPVESSMRPNSK